MIFIYEDFNFDDLRAVRNNCFYNFFGMLLPKMVAFGHLRVVPLRNIVQAGNAENRKRQ